MVFQKNEQPLILTMEYGNISVTQLKKCIDYIFIHCYKSTVIQINQVKLVFLFMINKNDNFECISIAKHIINLFTDKLNVKCIRKLVRKSYTPVVPIANTCRIGYPHDSRADNAIYRHDRRADNAAYRHDRRADSLSPRFAKTEYQSVSGSP